MDVRLNPRRKPSSLAAGSWFRFVSSDCNDAPKYGGCSGAPGGIHLLAIWSQSRMVGTRDQCFSFYCVPPLLLARDSTDLGALAAAIYYTVPGSISWF